ncbi:uncharacterized protein B0T23DRAFT_349001 [Neurospora hispaniola]|uniref:Uncharacterized protein n=1 Tax=Neurospora hispaniola TaxID=588809 RepID=A0AAJ0IFV4_9PEZI|nr:hypothetical protein B0T23DRAFT_349001 [Neurospora hispaniola]
MAGGLMNSIHAPKAHQPPPSSSPPPSHSHHSHHDEGDSFHDGPGPKSKKHRPPRKKQLMKYIPKSDPEPQQQSPPPPSPPVPAAAPVNPPSPPRAQVSPQLQPQAGAQRKPSVVAPSPPPPITTTSIPIRTTTSNTSPTPKSPVRVSPSAKHELIRYTKIVRRLKWKLPFLASGYALALKGRNPKHGDAVISGGVLNEGEIMFKLDFFEYYMLIERALVHLLGVFGITVSGNGIQGKGLAGSRFNQHGGGGSRAGSRGGSPKEGSPNRAAAGGGGAGAGAGGEGAAAAAAAAAGGNGSGKFQHRYHAHVLEAFDSPVHPLHDILGKGEVRKQLQRAKDLRNRWKTADSEAEEKERVKLTAPLESYDVEKMLETIFQGFDAAFLIAEWHVRDKEGGLEKGAQSSLNWADDDDEDGDATMMDWAAQEADQWEFMVDAMDWEAV